MEVGRYTGTVYSLSPKRTNDFEDFEAFVKKASASTSPEKDSQIPALYRTNFSNTSNPVVNELSPSPDIEETKKLPNGYSPSISILPEKPNFMLHTTDSEFSDIDNIPIPDTESESEDASQQNIQKQEIKQELTEDPPKWRKKNSKRKPKHEKPKFVDTQDLPKPDMILFATDSNSLTQQTRKSRISKSEKENEKRKSHSQVIPETKSEPKKSRVSPKKRPRKSQLELQKVKPVAQEENDDLPIALRRAPRIRVKPLQYWLGERIVYQADEYGGVPSISGVITTSQRKKQIVDPSLLGSDSSSK